MNTLFLDAFCQVIFRLIFRKPALLGGFYLLCQLYGVNLFVVLVGNQMYIYYYIDVNKELAMTLCLLVVITLLIAQLLDDIFRIDQILICRPEDDSMPSLKMVCQRGIVTTGCNCAPNTSIPHHISRAWFLSLISRLHFPARVSLSYFLGQWDLQQVKLFYIFSKLFLKKIRTLLIFCLSLCNK